MKIYTKTGDDGTTGLFGGARVSKDDPRVEAYGDVDELNSALGVALAAGLVGGHAALLLEVQSDLFCVGAELARAPGAKTGGLEELADADVHRLEAAIDDLEASLPALRTFILPGGNVASAALHLARTVCRRAERRVITLARAESVRPLLIHYLNRLSDLLFCLARAENANAHCPDTPWTGRAPKTPST